MAADADDRDVAGAIAGPPTGRRRMQSPGDARGPPRSGRSGEGSTWLLPARSDHACGTAALIDEQLRRLHCRARACGRERKSKAGEGHARRLTGSGLLRGGVEGWVCGGAPGWFGSMSCAVVRIVGRRG